MNSSKSRCLLAAGIIFAVLLIDQIIKFVVKTNMVLGEEFCVFGSWFRIHFVENNGMAFGAEIHESVAGKLFLSLFRIAAVSCIGWYLVKICRDLRWTTRLIVLIAAGFAGAVGNIIDSIFYGVCFSSSWGQVAEFLPAEGGYGAWLQGRVVDMFYFPICEGVFPDWFPIWAGESFIFFRPVFNFADAAISVSIVLLLILENVQLAQMLEGDKSDEDKLPEGNTSQTKE